MTKNCWILGVLWLHYVALPGTNFIQADVGDSVISLICSTGC